MMNKRAVLLAAVGGVSLSVSSPAFAGACLGLGGNVKWSQCPDLNTSFDQASNNHRVNAVNLVGDLVADDFQSDGRPVTDVHWWGSYEDNRYVVPENFWIGFWSDLAGSNPSQPSTLLKSYIVPFDQANESFFGEQERFPVPGNPPEKIKAYQYYVNLASAFEEEADQVYWLSIQALSSSTWGWKTADAAWDGYQIFRDAAQIAAENCNPQNPAQNPCPPLAVGSFWGLPAIAQTGKLTENYPPNDPNAKQYDVDMAFELTTVPEPETMSLVALGLGAVAFSRRRRPVK